MTLDLHVPLEMTCFIETRRDYQRTGLDEDTILRYQDAGGSAGRARAQLRIGNSGSSIEGLDAVSTQGDAAHRGDLRSSAAIEL